MSTENFHNVLLDAQKILKNISLQLDSWLLAFQNKISHETNDITDLSSNVV